MHTIAKALIGATVLAGVAAVAYAQGKSDALPVPLNANITVNDPSGPAPDPSKLIVTMEPKWAEHGHGPKGDVQTGKVFGDSKGGPYGQLLRWAAGSFSPPHTHPDERIACVISGTWWVSTSPTYDIKTTYPIPAGSCGEDVANQVHWDGARAGGPPVVLFVVGLGAPGGAGDK